MNSESILSEAEDMMNKAIEHTLHEFSTLHTGKASPSLVENLLVKVESYGTSMHLKELGAISTPDSRTIQIQPWDKSVVRDIEKAIQTAKLGLNPAVDSGIIRLPIPELSGDRRKELVKVAHTLSEEGRISVRHARHHALEALKKIQKSGEISEDDLARFEKEVQTKTDKHIADIGEHLQKKEQDLMAV